VTRLEPW